MSKKKVYFKPVSAQVNFVEIENKILEWWYKKGVVKKYLRKNVRSSKRFSFFDGPITANNPMGVHHAWGRTYKDLWQRFKSMQGYQQRFQNGFDCQGLWVEVEVEKDFGFKSKRDIENFGIAKFSQSCKERVLKFSKIQTEQSKRLGQWMDWENSYYTFSDKNIEYIWYFLKECDKKGWLYKSFQSLPWCARCGTSLSQHELFDSYKELTHKAVFFKLPVKKRENEFFLVWTTTPWTLAANVALAVNPKLIYARVRVGREIFILAKDLLNVLKGDYQIIEKLRGSQLKGLDYGGPFDEFPVQKRSQRKVLLWKDVSGEEGTGIVHIAPGSGEEDFELGKKNKLTVLVPLDENGIYLEGYGELSGKSVYSVNEQIFQSLEKKGLLYKIEDYSHRYPICWRCKEPIIFRAEENWFISADQIRPVMIKEAREVKWHPAYVGKLMEDWLKNMGDWNISRKRYYGLPLPFYECECGKKTIIGSKKELKKLAIEQKKVEFLKELHRPWIDEIRIRCSNCGKAVSRITDIGDCWLDAGIIPFSTLSYLEDQSYWKKWFPADWISEMREQVRLWFYSMLFMACVLEGKTPYREVLSYEKLYDEKGKPMHKSAGNAIWFDDGVAKIGADVMRWMYAKQNPLFNLSFGYHVADETRRQFHLLLWNIYRFFVSNASADNWKPHLNLKKTPTVLDNWILSRLNQLVEEVTNDLESFSNQEATLAIEEFANDLSSWYLRRSRERMGPSANLEEDKDLAYTVLYQSLVTLTKLIAPFVPFLAEEIYQNLTNMGEFNPQDSVHFQKWPLKNNENINKNLIEKMKIARLIVERGHSVRKQKQIKVRQPLSKLTYYWENRLGGVLEKIIADEINVKRVIWKKKKLKIPQVKLVSKLNKELIAEGKARELVRKIQELRKENNCRLDEKIIVFSPEIPRAKELLRLIKKKTQAEKIIPGQKLIIKKI